MNSTLRTAVLAVISGVALSACGGGGGGGSAATGTSRTVTGVISSMGSNAKADTLAGAVSSSSTVLSVNGTDYVLDDSASVEVEDGTGDESDLAEGQVVTLQTTTLADGTNVATAVAYEDELEGVVIDVSGLAGGTLNIMGQTVFVSADTYFSSDVPGITGISEIQAGNIVEVNGNPGLANEVYATRIEVKAVDLAGYAEEMEIKGTIDSGSVNPDDPDGASFRMGSLKVVYASADVSDMPATWDGLYVEVKTDVELDVSNPASPILFASKVEPEDDESEGEEGDEMERQGLVSDVDTAAQTITFNGEVLSVANAEFDDGLSLATLTGMTVELEGYMDGGAFVVTEVSVD